MPFSQCLFKLLDTTFVGFGVFVVVDPDEKQLAAVVRQRVEVFLLPDLVYCALRRSVAFQFDNHCGVVAQDRDENDIGNALARRHFLDDAVVVEGIDVGQIDGRGQGILVVVAAVGGDVDMGYVEGFCHGFGIPRDGLVQKLLRYSSKFLAFAIFSLEKISLESQPWE